MPLVCNTPLQSFEWASHGTSVANARYTDHSARAPTTADAHNMLTLSSGCSGIMCFDLAARVVGRHLQFTVVSEFVIEKDNSAREEILHSGGASPMHLIGDWYDCLEPWVKEQLRRIPLSDVDARRRLIMSTPTCTRKLWCLKCGRYCDLKRCHLHCSGFPCIHDSSFGSHGSTTGEGYNVLWIGLRQRLDLLDLGCDTTRPNSQWDRWCPPPGIF